MADFFTELSNKIKCERISRHSAVFKNSVLHFTSLYLPKSSNTVQNTNTVYTMQLNNSLGGCGEARSALTTAPYKGKEKKTSENKIKWNQSDNADERILKTCLHVVGLSFPELSPTSELDKTFRHHSAVLWRTGSENTSIDSLSDHYQPIIYACRRPCWSICVEVHSKIEESQLTW